MHFVVKRAIIFTNSPSLRGTPLTVHGGPPITSRLCGWTVGPSFLGGRSEGDSSVLHGRVFIFSHAENSARRNQVSRRFKRSNILYTRIKALNRVEAAAAGPRRRFAASRPRGDSRNARPTVFLHSSLVSGRMIYSRSPQRWSLDRGGDSPPLRSSSSQQHPGA